MDKNVRTELAEHVASKLLESADYDELEHAFFNMQKEWVERQSDEELIEIARDLGIVF